MKKTRLMVPGDLILTNSMSYGYPYIMNTEGAIHDGWLLIRMPEKLIDKIYIYNALLSGYVKEFFSRAASGAVVQNLNADKVRQLPIPLPPIPEQRRIVARIDQLMVLCGALEARLSAQASTQSALLGSLMDAVTPARSAPTPRPARPAASAPAPANAAQPSPARGRGRPRKGGGIPTASSHADAIRQLEALKLERAQGSRQVGLFEDEG